MQGTWCDKNEFISRDRLLTWMGEVVEIKKAHLQLIILVKSFPFQLLIFDLSL